VPLGDELTGDDCLVVIAAEAGRERTATLVKETFEQSNAQLLVVDTFPRGLGGELAVLLPAMAIPKALVHRDLNPKYIESFGLNDFVEQNYDLLLTPGEPGQLDSVPTLHTRPWLIRDSNELLSKECARTHFGLPESDQSPVVLVSGCGRPEEISEMTELAAWLRLQLKERVHVRFCSPTSNELADVSAWPLLPLLLAVDVLIGAGGYNTVSEARATQTPLLAFARSRMYDRQYVRLHAREQVENHCQLRDQILFLTQPAALINRSHNLDYLNGTHLAVNTLMQLSSP
jgi:hypothetical protein